ncbi:hypothetical protein ACFL1L_03225 [Thermoplasmatota archaeon]
MIITESEYESLVPRLIERKNELNSRHNDRNTILGILGEKFVGYCICHSLWKLGYSLNYQYSPHSYRIVPKYGANEDGVGGIDLHLTITNKDEIRYNFLIEIKNWAHYSITPSMFRTEILDRFLRVDSHGYYSWIITMNRRNIENLRNRCKENNIHILPIDEHITPDYVGNTNIFKNAIAEFIDAFCSLITELARWREYPYLVVEKSDNRPKWDMISQDILMGVPYDVIELRYNTTRGYICRCASDLRRWIRSLPDRRNKEWVKLWEVQG